jgi:hypothetical protein
LFCLDYNTFHNHVPGRFILRPPISVGLPRRNHEAAFHFENDGLLGL